MSKKKSQVRELQDKLNDPDIEQKQQGIRRIIDAMTRGKDVSMLFMDVIKNMETPSLQLKKLIHLYVMNYAKTRPELAIMSTNSFRKDAIDKSNPFLRGLSVRTMGCIRIKDIVTYLCDPLKAALKDEDAYVRKTATLCVPKLYQVSPEIIESTDFLKALENLLNDGNAIVVSNAIAALSICSEIKGEPLLKLTQSLVHKLLTAMNDCNEWGVVYILDTLSGYIPRNPNEAEGIMERVSSKLAHTNSAVALSSIRLILRYMDYLTHPESIRAYNNKISAPLITMISRESQISYLVLKTINLVLQKRPLLLPKELKIFFVNYHDPLYVKLEKLEVLAKISTNQNILLILHELKECVQEVDVEFVRRAVRTMGRCAIKLEKSADKCVQCLWDTIKTRIPYVVQEAVIVIRDIFRKYPNKYDGLLSDICENLKTLDDAEAKASIVWIIGEYVEVIENADEIIGSFAQNFKDEPDVVQHQILLSCMKLYLHYPESAQQILEDLFKYITKVSENPDLRDRGYLYWRLLSTDPKLAKEIVLAKRPLLTDQSYTLETELLEKLIENIGCLASVYGKIPQDFVKRLKDNANAREQLDEDDEQLLNQNKQKTEVEQKKRQEVTFKNKEEDYLENKKVQNQEPIPPPSQKKTEDLLDMGGSEQPSKQPAKDLLDMEEPEKSYSTTVAEHNSPPSQIYSNEQKNINFFEEEKNVENHNNIVVPLIVCISPESSSRRQLIKGLSMKAGFQRQGKKMLFQCIFENFSSVSFKNFIIKLNANTFKFRVSDTEFISELKPNEATEVKLQITVDNQEGELSGWPYSILTALKVFQADNQDVFTFEVPCCFSVAMLPDNDIGIESYKQISSNEKNFKKQDALKNTLDLNTFVKKYEDNNLKKVFEKDGGDRQLMSFVCLLTNGWELCVDVIFDKNTFGVNVQVTVPNQNVAKYFQHALAMIVSVP